MGVGAGPGSWRQASELIPAHARLVASCSPLSGRVYGRRPVRRRRYMSREPSRTALARVHFATGDTRPSVSQAECRRFESDRALHSASRQTAELWPLRATAGCVHTRPDIAPMARLCEVMQQADGVTSQPTTQGAQHSVAHRGQGACRSARRPAPSTASIGDCGPSRRGEHRRAPKLRL